jgi:hypothetical protein
MYEIIETHKTRYGNTSIKHIQLFRTKEEAEENLKLPGYKWRGNDSGSVGYSIREYIKETT